MRLALLVLLSLALLATAGGQPMQVPIVAGHPFSADEVIVEIPSPNVSNVPPKETIRVYRDLAGRTRIDPPVPPNPISTRFVNIFDPATGMNYTLDAQNKVARRYVSPIPPGWKVPTTRTPFPGVSFIPANPGNVTKQTESLGTQLIEGLMAEGERITSNSPKTPRDDAQENIAETWFSQELQMTLHIQVFNSRFGNRTMHVENIVRAEPDASLFQAPSDYMIVDQPVK